VSVEAMDCSTTTVVSLSFAEPRQAVMNDAGLLQDDCESRLKRNSGFCSLLGGIVFIGVSGVGRSGESLREIGVCRCAAGIGGGVPF
jgi:hypothetical protein